MPQPAKALWVRGTAACRRRERRPGDRRRACRDQRRLPPRARAGGAVGAPGLRDRLGRRARDRRGGAPRRARRRRRDLRGARLRRRRRLSRSARRAVRAMSPAAGGLLSEYPPGTPPRVGQFPARNRIVVGAGASRAGRRGGPRVRRADHRAARARSWVARCWRCPARPGTDELIAAGAAPPVATTQTTSLRALAGEAPRARPTFRRAFAPLAGRASAAARRARAELARRLGLSLAETLGADRGSRARRLDLPSPGRLRGIYGE